MTSSSSKGDAPDGSNDSEGGKDRREGRAQGGPPAGGFRMLPYLLVVFVLVWLWTLFVGPMEKPGTIPYSRFKALVVAGEVFEAKIHDREIKGCRKSDPTVVQPETAQDAPKASVFSKKICESPTIPYRTVSPLKDDQLLPLLEEHGVIYRVVRRSQFSEFLVGWMVPLTIIILLWVFLARRLGAAGQSVLSFGKSKGKLVADNDTGVSFADVAGCEEAKYELQEVVDFLKNPGRYQALGAKIPKGAMLVGPPGTGKTLLARAVAGEAGVPFYALSGSDFVEMFVGVGASRVRDLFSQAKSQAPCIIFIDELDAIGRQRGVHVGAVHDEREQTLNQLLVELDGFEGNVGVIVIAATNRPDVLDRALLRPGRFDRQIVVDVPDLVGREAILRVHARGKPFAEGTELRKVAQASPGFSGADLANALNEAALLAARRNATEISQADLDEAVEKVVAGPERRSRRLTEQLRRRVAFHEVGHAMVAAYSAQADPVRKISIVPRGRAALGYTLQLPDEDTYLHTRTALLDRIRVCLGGRASEETVYGEVSTGAENDLRQATAIARQMICLYGMGESAGLLHCAQSQDPFFMSEGGGPQRDCSDDTARAIDQEVRQLLDSCYVDAKRILTDHRDQLDAVTEELITREALDGTAFMEMLGLAKAPEPDPSVDGGENSGGSDTEAPESTGDGVADATPADPAAELSDESAP